MGKLQKAVQPSRHSMALQDAFAAVARWLAVPSRAYPDASGDDTATARGLDLIALLDGRDVLTRSQAEAPKVCQGGRAGPPLVR